MGLISGNTKWVLFLSSASDAEDRHVWDLAFGLLCLESAGVRHQDIFIYIDGQDRQLFTQIISSGSAKQHTIKESKDYFTDKANNTYENMVMFVTGHGGIDGIDAANPILLPRV